MPFLANSVLDNLSSLITDASHLYLCSAEPTTYVEATSTLALANKSGLSFVGPVDRAASGGGRKVTVQAITDGSITVSGSATHWALVKASTTTLLATGALSSSFSTAGAGYFTLPSFDIGVPDAV